MDYQHPVDALCKILSSPSPSNSLTTSVGAAATDIPDFELPFFTGQAIDDIDWMADVKDIFNNKGLIGYLEDPSHFQANIEFSTAFAFCLRTLVYQGTVLGHLYALEEKNNNCADLWEVITKKEEALSKGYLDQPGVSLLETVKCVTL